MKESENLYYSTFKLGGINFLVVTSHIGVMNIFINEPVLKVRPDKGIRLQSDDPYMYYVYKQLKEYFSGERKEFDIPLDLKGTEFQKRVWCELLKIPYGTTISYKELAIRVGGENKTRAVGQANSLNPVPIIIPCHRVINSGGRLGGYSCGVIIKEKLLETEGILSLELFSEE
jgi:methylated-DNA-[protein]-cysteine S-methyltransferase